MFRAAGFLNGSGTFCISAFIPCSTFDAGFARRADEGIHHPYTTPEWEIGY